MPELVGRVKKSPCKKRNAIERLAGDGGLQFHCKIAMQNSGSCAQGIKETKSYHRCQPHHQRQPCRKVRFKAICSMNNIVMKYMRSWDPFTMTAPTYLHAGGP